MAENMIFTVDAGIYVREWGIGLRIEDNVLVTASGCENLSAAIPATIEEIETYMTENKSSFDFKERNGDLHELSAHV